MVKFGEVVALDETKAQVRVKFDDMDEVVSYWLPVVKHKTLKDKQYWMPDLGEHVACLLDENCEEGACIGAIYSDADRVPVASKDKYHVIFADGSVIEYDRKANKLLIDIKGEINIVANKVNIMSNVSVTGNLDASGSIIDYGGNTNHHSH